MSESVEEFMARKSDPNWQPRLRRALRGVMPKGVSLPGERRIPRDARGRFAPRSLAA
jgi:hypothetical protein